MIAFLGNRPVLKIGRHHVALYGSDWLSDALRRAAHAAEHDDFPFIDEIRDGIFHYLETKCPLRLLPVSDLVKRVRRMLMEIGCTPIAERLEPFAPPVTISLIEAAREADNGFELAFFESLRAEIRGLRDEGASEIRFTGIREAVLRLAGVAKWNQRCDTLLADLRDFLARQQAGDARRAVVLTVDC